MHYSYKSLHCWLLLRTLLFLLGLLSATIVVRCVEISCHNNFTAISNSVFMVASNSTYTLTNCVSDALFLDMAPLNTGPDGANEVLENVTIRVVGGTVLPRLNASATTLAVVRNIHVSVAGAYVINRTVNASSTLPSSPITVLDISGSPKVVENVSVSFENSTLSIAVSSVLPIHVAPLLHLIGNALVSRFTDISVSCTASNLSILMNLSSVAAVVGESLMAMAAVKVAMQDGLVYNVSIEHVSVVVVSSSFSSIFYAESANSDGGYINNDVGLFLVRCRFVSKSLALLKNVVFFSSGNVSYKLFSSVPRNSSDSFSVVSINTFSKMDTLRVSFEGRLTLVSLEGVCGGANCDVALARWPSVRMVEVAGIPSVTQILDVSITASRAGIFTRTPTSAVLFACSNALTLRNISVDINDNAVRFTSSPLDVARSTQSFSLAALSSIDNATGVSITVKRCSLTFEQVAGGCVAALTPAINLFDNVSFASVDVSDVNVTSIIANGSMFALNGALAALTMGSSIVNVMMQTPSILNIGTNVHITVFNCTLIAAHSASVPRNVFVAMIASIVTVVNVVRSLSNSTIVVNNVHVTRSFLENQFDVSFFDIQTVKHNVTTAVALFDMPTAMIAASGSLSPFLSFYFLAIGGLPATVVHTNVTTTVTNNSSVLTTSSNVGDIFGLVAFPSVSNRCTYIVSDIASSTRSGVVGSVGHTTVINSMINVYRVSGVSSLMVATLNPLVFLGPNNHVTFDQVLVEVTDLISIAAVRFALVAVSTFIEDERTMEPSLPPLISMTRCQFRGFDAILNPSSFVLKNGGPLLRLGCNLWDGAPLPPSKIASNLTLRRFVTYPQSSFNESVTCAGFTNSLTATLSLPAIDFHPPAEPVITAAVAPTSVAVYLSLLSQIGSVGGGVSILQRAMASVRLAALCSTQISGSSGSGSENMMSNDLSENSLRLPLPVGQSSLRYAAGAAVGNALLACVVGVGLHFIAKRQHHHEGTQTNSFERMIVSMLPSSLLPGSIAIPYGTLGQPAISACIALLMSVDRSAQSVVCAALMLLCVWLAYPIGCGYLVLWRGRRGSSRTFVLRATRTLERHTARDAKTAVLQYFQKFLSTPIQKWRLHPGCFKRGTPERCYAEFLLENMEAVFGAYVGGREWFFVVEWGVLVVSAAVLGAAEITAIDDAANACAAAQWGIGTVLALSAAQVMLCVWLRPFSVRAEFYVAVLLGTLSVVCQALALAGDVDASAQVDSVAATLEIVFMVLLMVNNSISMCTYSETQGGSFGRGRVNLRDASKLRQVYCRKQSRAAPTIRKTPVRDAKFAETADQLGKLIEIICVRQS